MASVAVLAASNGAPIDEWSILNSTFQPQVWVAVMSVVSNALLGYAFVEGVAIQFWRQACNGTTVSPRDNEVYGIPSVHGMTLTKNPLFYSLAATSP
jgi:hypothetical protein